MRTTIHVADEFLEKAGELAAEKRVPFKTVFNEALRSGLELAEKPPKKKAYRAEARDMGLRRCDGASTCTTSRICPCRPGETNDQLAGGRFTDR